MPKLKLKQIKNVIFDETRVEGGILAMILIIGIISLIMYLQIQLNGGY